ncbi:LON peptidase substrate-binding domain-containing protein [Deinococcus peraridilitoris]|uniref:Peptidase S16, lon domain protein n=1 Tax=Deinococcus peraridilitoris (strain DSM 19664 / LMG 22246 / CIP 109416 / KR-200) TaxID=937777 RepID=K9ZYR1_DEIPD|nr:LON peptidase substrate-binding domain-containing protein [Deinococcus peraridilitoris]AFZ65895.1 peptidase S16, lon domain protein [Deinococcus peraridilitoris DSM 19664]
MTLPLFPLPDVVLLPGLVLPLYVFEPRYRELLARVRQTGEPFGISRLLPSPHPETPFEERVARLGTLAHLRHVTDHEDGTASIEVVGGERFEVQQFDHAHGYLSATVQVLPLPQGDPHEIEVLSRRLIESLARLRNTDPLRVQADVPQDPLLLATYGLALLPLSGEQREAALRASTLAERFKYLSALLHERTLN